MHFYIKNLTGNILFNIQFEIEMPLQLNECVLLLTS